VFNIDGGTFYVIQYIFCTFRKCCVTEERYWYCKMLWINIILGILPRQYRNFKICRLEIYKRGQLLWGCRDKQCEHHRYVLRDNFTVGETFTFGC